MSGFFQYVSENRGQILGLLFQHLQLTAIAVVVAIAVGVPLGILISRYHRLNKPVIGVANVVQAIPSMALLGFMIPFFGIGEKPAIFMVMLYALLPIVKNTATGLDNISKETLEAARGIGMTELQVLFRVQFPLALPVIMAGVRISAVTAVGLMTLASYIGAGGLGYLIYSGVQMVNTYMILAGAIPACVLALLMDFVFARIEKAVTPISLRVGMAMPASKDELVRVKRRRKTVLGAICACVLLLAGVMVGGQLAASREVIRVTSKYYPEQLIIGNMVSDLIEHHTGLTVERKLGMGGTDICFNAINSDEVQVQVEYTGTMYASVLGQSAENKDADSIYQYVKEQYHDQYGLEVMEDWGFNNTYALAVRKDTAEKYHLKTISDLAKVADQLTITPTFEFSNRQDGLIGLCETYGMEFGKVTPMDGGLRYTAIDNRECDVIVAYTTDSLVSGYDLVVLEDDKGFFLPYHAVPIIREDTLAKHPELADAVNLLADQLTDETMSQLNYQVEMENQKPEDVARRYLEENGYLD